LISSQILVQEIGSSSLLF